MRRVLQSSFIRAALVLASGTTLAQLVPFILTPVLTRIYTPEDMGVFSLYTSFVVVFLGALSLGFSYALVSADSEDVTGLVALSIYSIAILTIPVSCLALFLIHQDLLGFGALSPFIILSIALSLVVTELFLVLRYVVLRDGHYRDIASATVNQSIARIGSQVLMGLGGLGWWGLTFGDAIGRVFGVRRLWSRAPFGARDVLLGWSWMRFQPLARKYSEFAKYSAPGAVIDSLSAQIVAPLLAAQFGLAVAGQYAIVLRLLVLPVTLIGGSVADVFHNRLAEVARTRPQLAEKLFLQLAAVLVGGGLLFIAAILLVGEGPWTTILGTQWAQVGLYAAAIAPRAAVLLIVSPLSRTVLVFGGQRSKLLYNVFSLLVVIGTMVAARNLEWGALYTIAMISWVRVGAGLVYFLVLWNITRQGARGKPVVDQVGT